MSSNLQERRTWSRLQVAVVVAHPLQRQEHRAKPRDFEQVERRTTRRDQDKMERNLTTQRRSRADVGEGKAEKRRSTSSLEKDTQLSNEHKKNKDQTKAKEPRSSPRELAAGFKADHTHVARNTNQLFKFAAASPPHASIPCGSYGLNFAPARSPATNQSLEVGRPPLHPPQSPTALLQLPPWRHRHPRLRRRPLAPCRSPLERRQR